MKFSILVNELHLFRSKANLYYGFVFLLRRLIYSVLAYGLASQPSFQIMVLSFLMTLYMIYYGGQRPHELSSRFRLEVMNEMFVIACVYHMFIFSPYLQINSAKVVTGYTFIGLILLMILINVLVQGVSALQTCRYKAKLRQLRAERLAMANSKKGN